MILSRDDLQARYRTLIGKLRRLEGVDVRAERLGGASPAALKKLRGLYPDEL